MVLLPELPVLACFHDECDPLSIENDAIKTGKYRFDRL